MPGNFKKEDLRILKTKKALMDAMSKLLEFRSFTQITVNDLCVEALISRTTFYLHFNDKYDLLKNWLANIKSRIINDEDTYEDLERCMNDYVNKNKKIMKNLIKNSNDETSEILCEFMFSLLNINVDEPDDRQMNQKHTVLYKFCSGGMLKYLSWQIENKFPTDLPLMNPYFYDILISLQKWNKEQK